MFVIVVRTASGKPMPQRNHCLLNWKTVSVRSIRAGNANYADEVPAL